jgi:protein ImuA
MAVTAEVRAELCRLRRDIARLEGRRAADDRLVLDCAVSDGGAAACELQPREQRGRLCLGVPGLDDVLGGGLPLATLHEIRAVQSYQGAAAAGFVMAVLARLAAAGGETPVVWVSAAEARREAGGLYAPGLLSLGFDPGRIVEVAARTTNEALWAFEAALASRGVCIAVCELRQVSLDLSATRRCVLRARETGATGFLLRLASAVEASAAELRFRLAAAPAGMIDGFDAGIGRMAWHVALEKNRGGRTGDFSVEWNAHERRFVDAGRGRRADPQPRPAAALYRPAHQDGLGRTMERREPAFRRAS